MVDYTLSQTRFSQRISLNRLNRSNSQDVETPGTKGMKDLITSQHAFFIFASQCYFKSYRTTGQSTKTEIEVSVLLPS